MTRAEIIAQCKDVCHWCKQGKYLHYRADSNEYTHQWEEKSGIGSVIVNHRMCVADAIRKEHKDILEHG